MTKRSDASKKTKKKTKKPHLAASLTIFGWNPVCFPRWWESSSIVLLVTVSRREEPNLPFGWPDSMGIDQPRERSSSPSFPQGSAAAAHKDFLITLQYEESFLLIDCSTWEPCLWPRTPFQPPSSLYLLLYSRASGNTVKNVEISNCTRLTALPESPASLIHNNFF